MPRHVLEVEPSILKTPEYRRLLETKEKLKAARSRAAQRRAQLYWSDPVAWVHDHVKWPEGQGLAPYQEESLAALAEHHRAAVHGPHGLGKTCEASLAVHWFADTRNKAGVDWKIPTTASVWRQLSLYLWPEIHKWSRLLRWDVIGRRPYDRRTELLGLSLKLEFGEAFALASNDPSSLEGAHATELLYLFDESKSVSDETFDAAEGAFSTAGMESGTNAYALAISTPGEPLGRFYDICSRRIGTEDWWTRHVTIEEAIAAGRVTREWVEQRGRLWGIGSAVYANRVLGEFASSDDDGVIPLAWVEAANERWRLRYEPDGRQVGHDRDVNAGTRAVVARGEKVHVIGVDVAAGGTDRTVLALRQGNGIAELRRYPHTKDMMIVTGYVTAAQEGHGDPMAVVDALGYGAGVFDRLREIGKPARAFLAGNGTKKRDQSGEFGFANMRSWAWWNLRECLDPGNGMDLALPPDDRLTGDLVAPKWRPTSGGRIQVESKDDIRKRLGRSTDDGDSVMQAFAEGGQSWGDVYLPVETEEGETVPKAMAEAPDAAPLSRARDSGPGEVDEPEPDSEPVEPAVVTSKPVRGGGWGDMYRMAGEMAEREQERRKREADRR